VWGWSLDPASPTAEPDDRDGRVGLLHIIATSRMRVHPPTQICVTAAAFKAESTAKPPLPQALQ